MDGVLAHDFDMIDAFIADHHLDPEIAPKAMEMSSDTLARMLVDMHVPRTDLVRLARGLTPAKLTDVVSRLNALELAFAYSKMRPRKTPGNQAHVTNAKDDLLQLAADAAVVVGLGFDELETTMRVSRNSWSNALACVVGSVVGRWGCSSNVPVKRWKNYASAWPGSPHTLKQYPSMGLGKALPMGDDTPWSKAFLVAAYASRGIKARCISGARSRISDGVP